MEQDDDEDELTRIATDASIDAADDDPHEPEGFAQFGNSILVAPGQAAGLDTGRPLVTEQEWTIEVQAYSLPNGALSTTQSQGYLQAIISWSVGAATFRKTLQPIGLRVRRVPLTARHVTVNVAWVGPGANNPSAPASTPIPVSICISRGGRNKAPIEWWAPQWLLTQEGGTAGALYGAITTQLVSGAQTSGILLAARLAVAAMAASGAGATGMMVMLFDSPAGGSAPTTTAVPIWRSKPLVAANDWDAYDDEFGPAIEWDTGLWVGASSTYGTWTACGATPSFTFDLKQGS